MIGNPEGLNDLRPEALKDPALPRLDLGDFALVWPPDELTSRPGAPWVEHPCVAGDGSKILNTMPLHPEHKISGGPPPEPVTISPSVLCRSCGLHGFVRGSTWQAV